MNIIYLYTLPTRHQYYANHLISHETLCVYQAYPFNILYIFNFISIYRQKCVYTECALICQAVTSKFYLTCACSKVILCYNFSSTLYVLQCSHVTWLVRVRSLINISKWQLKVTVFSISIVKQFKSKCKRASCGITYIVFVRIFRLTEQMK